MSWDEHDEMEARAERARERRMSRCQCDPSVTLPCPGPANCPYSGCDDEPEEDADGE